MQHLLNAHVTPLWQSTNTLETPMQFPCNTHVTPLKPPFPLTPLKHSEITPETPMKQYWNNKQDRKITKRVCYYLESFYQVWNFILYQISGFKYNSSGNKHKLINYEQSRIKFHVFDIMYQVMQVCSSKYWVENIR